MKLRKYTAFLMSLVMLVTTSGIAISVHYCGEKIASVSSAFTAHQENDDSSETEKCCIEKAKENKKCCSDKVFKIKSKADVVTVKHYTIAEFVCPLAVQVPFFNSISRDVKVAEKLNYAAPTHAPPLYKLYSQYIFYA